MQTISIHGFHELQQFGVNPLTGEACKYSQRILCDLNEDGVRLVRAFIGLPDTEAVDTKRGSLGKQFAENWNSTVDGKPAIASVMLSRGALKDLCVFAILHAARCYAAIDTGDGAIRGVDEDYCKCYRELPSAGDFRFYINPTPGTGDRNQHAFTGRTE